MELSDLRIFNAVVEEGGITRAANRLHRVQSNVTTRIRQLEEDLGVEHARHADRVQQVAQISQLWKGLCICFGRFQQVSVFTFIQQ